MPLPWSRSISEDEGREGATPHSTPGTESHRLTHFTKKGPGIQSPSLMTYRWESRSLVPSWWALGNFRPLVETQVPPL